MSSPHAQMPQDREGYSRAVDSLRALCIAVVVLYHLDVSWIKGGYLGVDAFFVISGFLICRQIVGDLEAGTFSVAGFWVRRVRRLFPALIACVTATVLVGYVVLAPEDLRNLSKAAMAALMSWANVLLVKEAGYFDTPADLKPLLHTWSLSVEEQFYVAAPIALLAFYRLGMRRRGIVAILFGLAILSFAYTRWLLKDDPVGAFYYPHARAWEILAGAVVGLTNARCPVKLSPVAFVIGLGAIVLSCLYGTGSSSSLAFYQVPVVLGTALLLSMSGSVHPVLLPLVENRGTVAVGRWSYSIYLWHFPLVAFGKYCMLDMSSIAGRVSVIGAAVWLGAASYSFVEQPIRRGMRLRSNAALVSTMGALLLIAVGGAFAIFGAAKWPLRPETDAYLLEASVHGKARLCWSAPNAQSPCTLGSDNEVPTAMIWGDSHSARASIALDNVLKSLGKSAVGSSLGKCPPLLEPGLGLSVDCQKRNADVLKFLSQSPGISTVVLSAYWSVARRTVQSSLSAGPEMRPDLAADGDEKFESALKKAVNTLLAMGKNVVVIGQVPLQRCNAVRLVHLASLGFDYERRCQVSLEEFHKKLGKEDKLLRELDKLPNVSVVHPADSLCDDVLCRPVQAGRPLYFDNNHLTMAGAAILEPDLRAVLTKMLGDGEQTPDIGLRR